MKFHHEDPHEEFEEINPGKGKTKKKKLNIPILKNMASQFVFFVFFKPHNLNLLVYPMGIILFLCLT